MSVIVSPSLLSADFLHLSKDIEMVNRSQADWFHLDIMDGVFVPNISYGLPVVSQIKKMATKPLDVHLMIVQPERYVEAFHKAGADILTVHYEACTHLHRTIQQIKAQGMKAGVSLNPHTPVSLLEDVIEDIDVVLLMSVNPGFSGQKYISSVDEKIAQLVELKEKYGKDFDFSSLYKYVKFHQEFPQILDSLRPKSGRPLSWTHYRILLQETSPEARAWYAKEEIGRASCRERV